MTELTIEESKIDDELKQSEVTIENEESKNIDIGKVIDIFLHRIMDIEECASEYIPEAAKRYDKKSLKLLDEYQNLISTLESKDNKENKVFSEKELRKTSRNMARHVSSSPVKTLEKSLFVSLFSAFDKFIGDLIEILFSKKPNLYLSINKEIKVAEALSYDSICDLRQHFLDKEIETIRRKSYQEQFKCLENQFKITLTKFKQWPYFIEKS